MYLEGELLIEDRIEGLPVDLGLKLLLLVRQQVDLYVRVRCATHVHGRQLCCLDNPHYELREKDEGQKSEGGCVKKSTSPNHHNVYHHPTTILTVNLYLG